MANWDFKNAPKEYAEFLTPGMRKYYLELIKESPSHKGRGKSWREVAEAVGRKYKSMRATSDILKKQLLAHGVDLSTDRKILRSGNQCRPYDSRFLSFAKTDRQRAIYKLYGECGSNLNATAREYSKQVKPTDVSSISQAVRAIQNRGKNHLEIQEWNEDQKEIESRPIRMLFFDIETAPKLGWVWNMWKENVPLKQLKQDMRILSFSARWHGTDDIIYEDSRTEDDTEIVRSLIDLFDKAEIVVAHNGKAFDTKTVKGRALLQGIDPPSPYKIIDTYLVARNEFNLTYNSLDYLSQALGIGEKYQDRKFPGFRLWEECLKNNDEAWAEMEMYNCQDTILLEEVYYHLRPWISNHPNLGILMGDEVSRCPKCASRELEYMDKPSTTNVGLYKLIRCKNCKGYSRSRYTELDMTKRKKLLTNAV